MRLLERKFLLFRYGLAISLAFLLISSFALAQDVDGSESESLVHPWDEICPTVNLFNLDCWTYQMSREEFMRALIYEFTQRAVKQGYELNIQPGDCRVMMQDELDHEVSQSAYFGADGDCNTQVEGGRITFYIMMSVTGRSFGYTIDFYPNS